MRLKDWLKSGLQYGAIVVGASFLYGTLMGPSSVGEMLTMTAMYMLLFGAAINMLYNITVYKVMLPLALSFGSTRKEAFVGIQCYRLVYAVLVIGVAVPLYLLAREDGVTELMIFVPIGIGLMLMMNALGAVLGMIGNRFGKGFMAVLTVVGSLIACGIVVTAVILFSFLSESIGSYYGLWLLPVVGLVIYGLVSIAEHKAVKKYSVKL